MEYNGMEGIRWDNNDMEYKGRRWYGIQRDGIRRDKNGMKYKGRRWHGIQWDGIWWDKNDMCTLPAAMVWLVRVYTQHDILVYAHDV
jgi:hypothetical protein